ncbi:MAG: hypothetical protein J6N74_07215 [Chryseobacterium sp.]|nr:hypothetical protein [Chryseobacterium sp.]
MSTIYETGHARNIANFQKMIEFVTEYGADYNPSKRSLTLPTLITLKADADAALLDVITKNTLYNGKVNTRIDAFADLRPLSTRLVNALQSTDASAETIKDAKAINKKIQGKRSATPPVPTDPDQPAPNSISASQQSYDQLTQHFTGLKTVLQNEPTYMPNEADLQIPTLDDLIADLTTKNNEVAKAYTKISNARIERDKIIYDGKENLLETASEVKNYVKSVFGAASPQYKQVNALRFRK